MGEIEEPDVVIIGAGPAGTSTAAEITDCSDKTVVLIDRREVIGVPGRCAGGISYDQMDLVHLKAPQHTITNEVFGMKIFSPNMTELTFEDNGPLGFIVDRPKFDQWLHTRIDPEKCETLLGTPAKTNGDIVTCGTRKFRPKTIVLATALDVKMAQSAGINVWVPPTDVHKCVQVTIESRKFDTKYLWLYFGKEVAPDGYAWVFPERDNLIRVGLGISQSNEHSVSRLLDAFILKMELFGAPQTFRTGKFIPTLYYPKSITNGKVALVGDAGFQCGPSTGGGIGSSLVCGKILGSCIALGKSLETYDKEWRQSIQEKMETQYLIKRLLAGLDDSELDQFAEALKAYKLRSPADIPTVGKKILLGNRRLLWKAMKMKLLRR